MRPIFSTLIAFVAVACAAPAASDDTVAPTTAGDASSTTAPSTTIPVLGAEVAGRWAHLDVVAYEEGDLKTLIISFGFNDFEVVNGRVIDSASFCFAEQRTNQPIETSISDAATQAIRPPSTAIKVDLIDGRVRIRRAATPTPVGIVLADPAVESLPTDPNDPRIVDDDGDGKPGITVKIVVGDALEGELYLARREIFAYEAFLVSPDEIVGTVEDRSEQLVIGASDPIFTTAGSNWVQYADRSKSPIFLRRVTGDWDCARLARERDSLFPVIPEIDW
ncbi:MAG: hypothetical protein ACKOA2_03790 [Ilumatobacteraceae bacterium]